MSDTELEARDIRAGYIAWCRGELPRDMAGEKFDRFIAKVKADALREAAIEVTTQVNNAEAAEADEARDPGPYYHGARYGMRKTAHWLHDRADRIEEES